jgi:type VI secretion system protein ImpK
MTDAFARVIGPIIQHVLEFQRSVAQGQHPDLEAERAELLGLLDTAEQKADASRDTADAFPLARHALIYWIDEVLINSGWTHAPDWRNHILEWDFFRERLGGERFYEMSREAESKANADGLETYFLCVSLGFRGQHSHAPRELQAWSERVYHRIAESARNPDHFLPNNPKGGDERPLQPLPGPSILLTVSVLASASLLVSLAVYIIVTGLHGS